jgi:CheY-like chemotaxis protein
VERADQIGWGNFNMQSLSALLLSDDTSALCLTERILAEYNFDVIRATTVHEADDLIRRRRFDLAVYDHDMPGAIDLASTETQQSSPRVVFLMLGPMRTNLILSKRIHLLLPKPFSAGLLIKSLQMAYGTILREKRLSFRYDVEFESLSTTLVQDDGERNLQPVKILNLSQTGMCLHASQMLPQGAIMRVGFTLPEDNQVLQCIGTVMWAHLSGKAGIKFTAILPSHRKKLYAWLDSLLPWDPELRPKTELVKRSA